MTDERPPCDCHEFGKILEGKTGHTASCERKERARLEKLSKPVKTKKPITKDLKDSNLWVPFSKFIRLRDSDEKGICTCFTCGDRQPWNSGGMQAGHFIGRRHWSTRYHEKNVNGQCSVCNHFNGGMQFEYALRLDIVYGEGTAMMLRELSNETKQMNQDEIDELAAYYRGKVREMLNGKNYTDIKPII